MDLIHQLAAAPYRRPRQQALHAVIAPDRRRQRAILLGVSCFVAGVVATLVSIEVHQACIEAELGYAPAKSSTRSIGAMQEHTNATVPVPQTMSPFDTPREWF
jgi:hypothetical protein